MWRPELRPPQWAPRSSGNCRMELLLGFLRNPRYHTLPVWKLIQNFVTPLQKAGIEWGPLPPYVIAGQFNQHPRAAMAWRAGEQRDLCADFFEKVMADV